MATYNFKKESRLYVVYGTSKYLLAIYPDLSFSQTFDETSVPVKTLHSQYDMFENAVITKANPANFSFTIPVLLQRDSNIVLDLLLDYDLTSSEATLKTADLYVESNSEIYKLEKAVFESGTFQIARDAILTLNVSGTARKLSKYTGTIPGTLVARTASPTFTRISRFEASVGGVVQKAVTSVSLEVKNDVQWVDFSTLQNSLDISDASRTMYAEAFVVGSRTVNGMIQTYVTDENNTKAQGWARGVSLSIRAGELSTAYTLEVDIPSVVYTNRIEMQDLIIQSYDFKMLTNPTALNTIIKKRSI